MKKLIDFAKRLWCKYNPFDVEDRIDRMVKTMHDVKKSISEMKAMMQQDIILLEKELDRKENILRSIIETLPDMVWFKDMDGRYVYANAAIKNGLLLCMHPEGKTDVELAKRAKELFGDENHTFGQFPCVDSDGETLKRMKPSRFMESGKVKGKMLYLEVFKAPVIVEGEVIGVCGAGRDLTEYMEAVESMKQYCAKRCGESEIVAAFDKYRFTEGESAE